MVARSRARARVCISGKKKFLRTAEVLDLRAIGPVVWKKISDMPKARSDHACATKGDSIFIVGGLVEGNQK